MSEDELRRCETRVDGAMRDPWVKFMIDAMHDMGCPIDRSFFSCVRCGDGDNRPLCGSVARFRSKSDLDMATVAGLPEVDDDTIVNIEVCADAKMSFQRFTKFLTHELVHVYDFGRSRINMTNLLHHACTEIRANNLSRECYTMEEFRRGFFDIRKRHPECVRRRAIKSVAVNPYCKTDEDAEIAVDRVWNACYRDTAPFERVP